MYRSNQARIKKENPSLLPSRGQTPRGRLSLTLTAPAANSTRGTVARGYCSASSAVAPLNSPSPSSGLITHTHTDPVNYNTYTYKHPHTDS